MYKSKSSDLKVVFVSDCSASVRGVCVYVYDAVHCFTPYTFLASLLFISESTLSLPLTPMHYAPPVQIIC